MTSLRRIGGLLAALMIWLAAPASATQDAWPALFDVAGVAANDVLNIRERPDVGSPVVGVLPPDARGVEVIAPDDRIAWGLVNTGEGAGWVSLRFLHRRPGQWTYSFPPVAACFGTEPFWTLEIDPDTAFLSPDGGTVPGAVRDRLQPMNGPDRFGLVVDMEDGVFHGVMQRAECSDGMSDRLFGIEVNAFYRDRMLRGCCALGR